ncbi:protein yippee-like At3g08990 [Lycium ferocissimum]|uniref:protein yippee-like At3g08990 n=1 Tax=Lycium ferocissimum TaxID=112874 RepID=UPI002815E689|nr:protein yippee-like At3g08990 [Lycium ferocissimum]
MGRLFLVEYDQIPSHEYIHCGMCGTRVAFVEDRFATFNVEVPENEIYHQQEHGPTLADTYCIKCGNLLGWKLIAVPQPNKYIKEGRFVMKLDQLNFLPGGANQQAPHNQDGGANQQSPNNQDGNANEQNANQHGDAIELEDDEDGDAPMN